MHPEEKYMRRALQLAAYGYGSVSPNPMVGAVIVAPNGKIIGEGWHRKYGAPHAEVNAVNSVKPADRNLLSQSTIYVTLEPCSHYGKTPPCSKLLIEKNFKKVVVGCLDPFKEVSGRGIRMLREAGIEVLVPFMEKECMAINRKFMTAHSQKRPFIMLKWAQSNDGFMGKKNEKAILSSPLSMVDMHRERAGFDAILVGTNTIISDDPSLTNRLWAGNSPRPVIFNSENIPLDAAILQRDPILLDRSLPLFDSIRSLYMEHKITSLMVEGGSKILNSFISENLYDEIRVETAPIKFGTGIPAPMPPAVCHETKVEKINDNIICYRIY